jgi:hypothetical protein
MNSSSERLKWFIVIIGAFLAIAVGIGMWLGSSSKSGSEKYDACLKAGYPVALCKENPDVVNPNSLIK